MILLNLLSSALSVAAILVFGLGGSACLAYACLALILRFTTAQRHYNRSNANSSNASNGFATSRRRSDCGSGGADQSGISRAYAGIPKPESC